MGKICIYIQCRGDILLQSHLSLDVNVFTRLIRLCITQVLLTIHGYSTDHVPVIVSITR